MEEQQQQANKKEQTAMKILKNKTKLKNQNKQSETNKQLNRRNK